MSRLDPRLLLQGYATGIFPMADSREADELFWVEPRNRAIIPLDRFHVSRSLGRTIRSGKFTVTRDRDFAGVIAACADREETWINAELEQAMLALHGSGHAHSIEVWRGDELAGGVYGVKLGRAFFGESMFSRVRDASKVALAWLVARMKVGNFTLLDCQFMTDHLASLGAVSITRETYVALLSAALGGGDAASAGALVEGLGRAREGPADFAALDRLLDVTGAAGSGGPAGYVIWQLLGHTS
jgi:leucyl/phenylalanyl-tRNA--protein transferase